MIAGSLWKLGLLSLIPEVRLIFTKAIRRIAQPQSERLRLSGLGAAPQQAENHLFRKRGMDGFFAFVYTDALLAIMTYEKNDSANKARDLPK